MENSQEKLNKLMNKISSGREYRKVAQIEVRALEGQEENYRIEGYATVFNQPYTLYD